MTIYARSDLCYVGISRDHGGCGEGHGRPVINGAPAKIWALTCHNGCEDFLRSDPLWAITPLSIPETPDEITTREDVEKRGMVEQAQSTASALEQLAKLGALPEVMGQFMKYMMDQKPALPETIEEIRLCKNGHRNSQVSSFCADCGSSLNEAVSSDRGKELAAPVVTENSVPEDLESLSIGELRELAKQLDVKTARSRDDQIAVIREALIK
jgi:hypothetical protein